MLNVREGGRVWNAIQAGNTQCSLSNTNKGLFITLNKKQIHQTFCLGLIQGLIVDVTSDQKLYFRTCSGEAKTFFSHFPQTDFGPFRGDLLDDIGGIREEIKPKILELV